MALLDPNGSIGATPVAGERRGPAQLDQVGATTVRLVAEHRAATAELTIVVPTYNERPNVAELVERLHRCLAGIDFEVLFVDDDSPDGTADEVRALAQRDPRVRCLHRIGRRGLSSACVEGMLASAAPYLAVIDADLQHDETLLPQMLELLRAGSADLVVGSRYLATRDVPDWSRRRQLLSRLATGLGRRLVGDRLGRAPLTDPMSGFFMLTRAAFQSAVHQLSAVGFKILLDIVVSSPRPLRITELSYRFRRRHAGTSKLDGRVAQDFVLLLLDKAVGRWMPPRFVLFTAIGGLGVLVHLATLLAAMHGLGAGFVPAQALATLVALTSNFALNNELTYYDQRLRGTAWLRGWLSFAVACSLGAIANVGVAAALFQQRTPWLLSALAGIVVGAVWNYAATAFYTWRR